MKKILMMGCALFIFAAASQAQSTDTSATTPRQHMQNRRGGDRMMGQRAELNKKLNLTADQETKLKAISDSFRKDRGDIKNNTNLSDDQKKQAYRDLFKKNNDARQAIYTPEQKAIIEKSMKDRRAQRGDRGGRKMKTPQVVPDQQ
ncbi:MAG TPA: hypothetical protein VL053_07415 [Arachidicoccus sp.]|nr:hypothetical protein [Arachidicoccus sp.]